MEPIEIKVSEIRVSLIFRAPSNIVERLRPFMDDIRAGRIERIPVRYRGIFDPIKVEKTSYGFLCRDGNHRIAVFKVLGLQTIKAYLVVGKI